ncbi:hypothetical protein XpopCFBP1817_20690 [Xanthomonas populi]|uniref:Uncharacterized protein n=1 Tax=Xanthomonas populi TaxID=53414 RepID=A0A2S7DZU0_9XANT|nr:hypothetical protein XpopCFBP1817_20690 [Xanthomonas populi]
MTWATPLGDEVAQARSPGPLHNRWCCDSTLNSPIRHHLLTAFSWVLLAALSLHGLKHLGITDTEGTLADKQESACHRTRKMTRRY